MTDEPAEMADDGREHSRRRFERARALLLATPRTIRRSPEQRPDLMDALVVCWLFEAEEAAEDGRVLILRKYLDDWGIARRAIPTVMATCAKAGAMSEEEAQDMRRRIAQAALASCRERVMGTAPHDKEGGGGSMLMTDTDGTPLIRINPALLRLASDIVREDNGTAKPAKVDISGKVSLLELASGPGLPRAEESNAAPPTDSP